MNKNLITFTVNIISHYFYKENNKYYIFLETNAIETDKSSGKHIKERRINLVYEVKTISDFHKLKKGIIKNYYLKGEGFSTSKTFTFDDLNIICKSLKFYHKQIIKNN